MNGGWNGNGSGLTPGPNGSLVSRGPIVGVAHSLLFGWATLGDSITAQFGSFSQGGVLINGETFVNRFGYAGKRSDEILTHVPDVIASGATRCIVMAGTNDVGQNTGAGNLYINAKKICVALYAGGVLPTLCFIPPHTTYPDRIFIYNLALEVAAAELGIQIVNCWEWASDVATGVWASGFSVDLVHPSASANGVAAAILAPALISGKSDKLLSSCNPGGLLTDGCFITDTNSDGVADGWTAGGTGGTYSLVPSTRGNKQRILCNLASASDQPQIYQNISVTAGHKYHISSKVRINNSVNNLRVSVTMRFKNGGGAGLLDLFATQLLELSGADATVFTTGIAPAGAVSAQVFMQATGGGVAWPSTGEINMERIQVVDMTAAGL